MIELSPPIFSQKSKYGSKKEFPLVREPLDDHAKDSIILHAVRMPAVFQLAKERLAPTTFDLADRHYAIIWRATLNLAKDDPRGEVPTIGLQRKLEGEVQRILAADPETSQETYDCLMGTEDDPEGGLLAWMFSFKDDGLDAQEGKILLKKYLHDQLVVGPLKEYVYNLGGQVPEDISEVLKSVELQKQRVDSINDVRAVPALTRVYKPMKLPMFPTNLLFLDEYMNGGQCDSEAYVLLGPTGVGKTTLGIQICCSGARYAHQVYKKTQNPDDLRHWLFFSYEQPLEPDIYHRVWSHMAQIHIDTFRNGEDLSTSGNLKDYEKARFRTQLAQNLKVAGERERFENISKELDPLNLWLIDMSGKTDPNAGRGGLPEIVRALAEEEAAGKKIGGICIDYAGLVVDRYIKYNNKSQDHIRHELRGFMDECMNNIASRYKCPVWVLHQLAGAVNKKSADAKQHHADAAECKTFADNAQFAFSLGTKDRGNMCRISCTKSRRSPGTTKEQIIFIDGAFSTMRSVEGQYVYDPTTDRIVPISDQRQVAGPGVARRARGPVNPAAAINVDRAMMPRARNVDLD